MLFRSADALHSHSLARTGESLDYPLYRVRNHLLALPTREAVEEVGDLEVPVAIRDSEEDTDRTVVVRTRWEAEVFPTRLLDLFVVEATVTFEGEEADAAKREISLTAYRPAWSESDESERLVETKEEEFADRRLARGVSEDEEEEGP